MPSLSPLTGRTTPTPAGLENREKLKARDAKKLEAMVKNNMTLQGRHEKRLKQYWALRNRPRICTYEGLLDKLMQHNPETGKEHSYAEKLKIVRDQIQLRTKSKKTLRRRSLV